MNPKNQERLVVFILAVIFTAALYWLGSEFRPAGVLGALQIAAQQLAIFPYIFGAMVDGSAHSVDATAYTIALFLELYLLIALMVFLWKRLVARYWRNEMGGAKQ